ncbi:MAG: DUF6526 family protein [Pyrinomonadaceae bacterium]
MADQQNYANHARWFPLFHFVVLPLLLLHFLAHVVRLIMAEPGSGRITMASLSFLSLLVLLAALAARNMALRVQDRVIRLEERLRYKELLPAEVAAKASDLPVGEIIALRFASDAELPGLVEKVLNGELKGNKPIKQAVQTWRADHLRA